MDLESKTVSELEAIAKEASKRAAIAKSTEKLEALRASAIEAVQCVGAEKLPDIIALCRRVKVAKIRRIWRWDATLGKNRAIGADEQFIEPAILLKGPKAKIPIL